ncbi:MAG: hypothetical protein ABI540_01825 [Spartobacteria bacterium]
MPAGRGESFRKGITINGLAEKKAAEEKYFGREENLHSKLGGGVLLLDVVELLGQWIMGGGFAHRLKTSSHLRLELRARGFPEDSFL